MLFNDTGIRGLDLSYGDGYPPKFPIVDLQKAKAYGMRFMITKAGQGDYMDPSFPYNWKAAKGVLPRHSYWYYSNLTAPRTQAAKYWQIMSPDPDGVYWLDLEDSLAGSYLGPQKWKDFLDYFKLISGVPNSSIGIYTGYYYFKENTVMATSTLKDYFKNYKLWLASYPPNPFAPDFDLIDAPYPWTECLLLQSGTPSIGSYVGTSSDKVDYDIFNGDEFEFNKYFSSSSPQGESSMFFRVTASSLNVRSSAGATLTNDLGDYNLTTTDVVEVLSDPVLVGGVPWRKLSRVWRNNVILPFPPSPTNEYWVSSNYLELTSFTPPGQSRHTVKVIVDDIEVFRKDLD